MVEAGADKFIYFNVLRRGVAFLSFAIWAALSSRQYYTRSLHNPGSTNLSQQFTVILKIIAKGCAREAFLYTRKY